MNATDRTALGCLIIAASLIIGTAIYQQHPHQPTDQSRHQNLHPTTRTATAPATAPDDRLTRHLSHIQLQLAQQRRRPFRRPIIQKRCTPVQLKALFDQQWQRPAISQQMRRTRQIWQVMGLLEQDQQLDQLMSQLLTDQVAGAYDPKTGTLIVIDRPQNNNAPLIEAFIFAHELTHALDDQYYDLQKMTEHPNVLANLDLTNAATAMIEGSAMIGAQQYLNVNAREYRLEHVQLRELMKTQFQQMGQLDQFPPVMTTSLIAPYVIGPELIRFRGGRLIDQLMGRTPDCNANVDQLFNKPPQSTEQVLHPAKYWLHNSHDPPTRFNDPIIDKALIQVGLIAEQHDTLGELIVAVLTRPADWRPGLWQMLSSNAWTHPPAIGWGGDRVFLCQTKPDQPIPALWITHWDTAGDCQEFEQAFAKHARTINAKIIHLGPDIIAYMINMSYPQQRRLTEILAAKRHQLLINDTTRPTR